MREIKFRAWDKEEKQILDVSELNIGGEEITGWTEQEECIEGLGFYHIVLMQSTGLKDKNGVEIYEGDIVEAWSEGVKAIGQVQQRKDGLWIIYPAWQSEKFWGLCPNEEKETRVTILGNIFEHPELLEVE